MIIHQAIQKIHSVMHQAKQEEIDRFSKKMDAEQKERIENISQKMIDRFIQLSTSYINSDHQKENITNHKARMISILFTEK